MKRVLALLLMLIAPSAAQAQPNVTGAVGMARAWIAQSQVNLGNEDVTLISTPQSPVCARAGGCSSPGITFFRTRFSLYYELGHQYDWAYLTAGNKAYLSNRWHLPNTPWTDTNAGLLLGNEDGVEGIFPLLVADCAMGVDTTRKHYRFAPGDPVAWTGTFASCRWLDNHALVSGGGG